MLGARSLFAKFGRVLWDLELMADEVPEAREQVAFGGAQEESEKEEHLSNSAGGTTGLGTAGEWVAIQHPMQESRWIQRLGGRGDCLGNFAGGGERRSFWLSRAVVGLEAADG
jgi:hypothetical protein